MIEDKKLFPITWSKLDTFERCPRKFWLQYGSKFIQGEAVLPYSDNKYTRRGNIKHNLLEKAAGYMAKGMSLTPELTLNFDWEPWYGELLNGLFARYPNREAERRIAISRKCKPIAVSKYYKPIVPGSDAVYMQGAVDLLLTNEDQTRAAIIDYKTGKARKAGRQDQLGMYALLTFVYVPTVTTVKAIIIFLDQKSRQEPEVYTRKKDFHSLLRQFNNRCDLLLSSIKEGEYRPNASDTGCRWCGATDEMCDYASQEGKT